MRHVRCLHEHPDTLPPHVTTILHHAVDESDVVRSSHPYTTGTEIVQENPARLGIARSAVEPEAIATRVTDGDIRQLDSLRVFPVNRCDSLVRGALHLAE
eukprot:SAG31_NODE_855_length_11461_cov_5.496215_3_plen_100_part_00